MKRKNGLINGIFLITALAALCCAALSACSGDMLPDDQIDIADTVDGEGIVSAEGLIDFIENGDTDTATLLAPIDLGNEMLRLTAQRGAVIINGSEYNITGSGDCVLRMEDGCTVTLNDVTIDGHDDGIGCLGDAVVGGENCIVIADGNALVSPGTVTVSAGSTLTLTAQAGCGITAKTLTLANGARVATNAVLNAVITTNGDLTLMENAALSAYTETNYNAVKCVGVLVMKPGSSFTAENGGDYHGAELERVCIEGMVTVRAAGGSKGMGMFIFTQNEDICVVGECTPEPQYESGLGSITFVSDAAAYDEWTAAQAAQAEPDSGDAENDEEDAG